MQAQRYQRRSLSLLKRKSKPDTWVFRYYVDQGSRRAYKKQIVGIVMSSRSVRTRRRPSRNLGLTSTRAQHLHPAI